MDPQATGVHRLGSRFVALATIAMILAVSGCGVLAATEWSTISPVSDSARAILDIYEVSAWWTLIIFLGVEALLLYALIRYRHRAGDSGVPEQVHGFTALEIGWTLLPAAILFFIAIPTVRSIFALQGETPQTDPIEITVVGHQWWWEFQYPELGIETANELHIPVDRTVELTLTTADVIHSFWVPRLSGKRDLNPGSENRLWFTPDSVGRYVGQCAELCGTSHANMRLVVFVEDEESFDAWAGKQKSPAVADSVGMSTFMGSGCAACHAITGTAAQGQIGPDLTTFGSRETLASGILENSAENLAAWLRDPPAVKPGSKMPNLNLSEERVEMLVEFLGSLK